MTTVLLSTSGLDTVPSPMRTSIAPVSRRIFHRAIPALAPVPASELVR